MKRKHRLAFVIIILVQVLILVGLVGFNEATLAFGKTVVLRTVPVDPRDIFRGDFVMLRYEISTLRNIPGARTLKEGDKAYVRLEQRDDVWEATYISGTPHEDWALFIAGDVTGVRDNRISMEYGIEAYFVPEGEGRAIEHASDLKVRVSIDGSGKAVIKNLIVDGETFQLR